MTAAEVFMWGTRIGVVVYDDAFGVGSFEYDSTFLGSGIEVSPVVMPLEGIVYSFPELNRESFHGLPGMLSDSLPDKFGNAVIDSWLSAQGRSPDSFNPVERLCYTGKRGMGALEYVPARGPLDTGGDSLHIDRLVALASDILSKREGIRIKEGEDTLLDIIKVGTSAGGARAKAVIAWNEESGDIRSGQINAGEGYGYWLMKFDGVKGNRDKEEADDPQYTRIEYAYYLMAADAGIEMSECRLYKENERYHFMTRRFDRKPESGDKIHMQTLGGIAHFDFNMAGAYGYEQTAMIMRRLKLGNNEIKQLFRRMVFNVLACNHDDHVKNISFLMNRMGKWSLSPAYDITYAYNPEGFWTGSHQMTVNGKRENIQRDDLMKAATNMGVKTSDAKSIIEEVAAATDKWEQYAEKAGLREDLYKSIGTQLVNLMTAL